MMALRELALEHGLTVDHSSLNRWVIKYAPLLVAALGMPPYAP